MVNNHKNDLKKKTVVNSTSIKGLHPNYKFDRVSGCEAAKFIFGASYILRFYCHRDETDRQKMLNSSKTSVESLFKESVSDKTIAHSRNHSS